MQVPAAPVTAAREEPFDAESALPAHPFQPDEPVELAQVDRKRFRLLRGFSYRDPDGERHRITPAGVGCTDLASVPSILWWFVASYGRHTRAALVHDQLIDQTERHDADWVFRRALGDSGIGWARRWLAWTAVSFETTFRTAWQPTDAAKTEAIARHRAETGAPQPNANRRRLRRGGVRRQRGGPAVTVVGFSLVGVHGALAVWFAYRAFGGAWYDAIAAVLLGVTWVVVWGAWRTLGWAGLGRLTALIGGTGVIVPFTALLFVPLGIVWLMERIVWLGRTVFWRAYGKPRGHERPPAPDFGSTYARDPRPLQRL
jgi:hypothetical protein